MTPYRFKDAMGDVIAERDFAAHAEALRWAAVNDELDDDVMRVEYRGPEGDWRWAGAIGG